MSQSSTSARSKGWSQVHFPGSSMMNLSTHSLRGDTGLPLVECPDCKKAALLELTCRKGANVGKVFYKCPVNQQNVSSPSWNCRFGFQLGFGSADLGGVSCEDPGLFNL